MILTKLGTCIDMKEIWFGIANGQILSFDRVICPRNTIIAGYFSLTFFILFFLSPRFWKKKIAYIVIPSMGNFKNNEVFV